MFVHFLLSSRASPIYHRLELKHAYLSLNDQLIKDKGKAAAARDRYLDIVRLANIKGIVEFPNVF